MSHFPLRLRTGILAAMICIVAPVTAQDADLSRSRVISTEPLSPLPPEVIEARMNTDAAQVPDSLSEQAFFERLSVLYGYQSDLMAARARGETDTVVRLVDAAIVEIGDMIRIPDVPEEPRFADVYRTIVSEYERIYGPSDTLFTAFGDVFELRKDVFAALEEIEDPLLEDITPPALQPVGTTFPMTNNRLVENSMEFLLREREDVVKTWIKRADTYFPMVEQIFREEGVPDELKYLSMIESGLNPRARSWARAVGMWQFIAATGRAYDLEVNAWVDERMDPEQSTRAAARHLRDLYEMYDEDWQVAIAGYNCSPRCIRRAERRARSAGASNPDFWDMYPYLPRETRNYVPLFIATSLIASNPSAYDIQPDETGRPYAYHLVPVTGMLSLADVADMAGTDVSTIKALNPNLRRDTLPPSTGPFYLRIPTGTYEKFTAAYEALPAESRRPSGEYVVRRGDTLSEISDQFGVSVSRLMSKNGLRSTRLQIGQRLVVPLGDYSTTIEDVEFADAGRSTVQYPVRISRPILMQQSTFAEASSTRETAGRSGTPVRTVSDTSNESTDTDPSDNDSGASEESDTAESETPRADVRVRHTVRRGDTLSGIASRYGVSIRDIQGWNSMSDTRINSGQTLTIFTDGRDAPSSSTEPVIHRVERGDTLIEIAASYNVTVTQLRQWNGVRGSNIRIGDRLTVHPGTEGSDFVTHTVRNGDTLIEIAGRYGATVARIKTWNGLSSNTIHPGQTLKIYR